MLRFAIWANLQTNLAGFRIYEFVMAYMPDVSLNPNRSLEP